MSVYTTESLEDTITVLNEYGADVIVLRHDEEGGAEKAAAVSEVPIINAGDGPGQHPTQAQLDLYTIKRYLGKIDGNRIVFVGDLLHSRTVHSLIYNLVRYDDIKIDLVSPIDLKVKQDLRDYLVRHNVDFTECEDLREVARFADVFYQTRTQTNLGTEARDRRNKDNGCTLIDREILNLAKPTAIILHPLPCIDEIVRAEVDPDPRAVYIKSRDGRVSQVKCGLYIRTAELLIVIAPDLCSSLLN